MSTPRAETGRRSFRSVRYLIVTTTLSVFVAEAAVMLILPGFGHLPKLTEAFLDASLLVLLISPAIYGFVFHPLTRLVAEKDRMHAILLETVKEEWQAILRTATDGFWVVDMEGRLLDVNESYCRLSGHRRDELLSMRVSDLEAREEPEETRAHIQRVIDTGYDRFETRHRRKDGSIVDVEVSATYLAGRGGRLVAFVREIAGRKKAEGETKKELDDLLPICSSCKNIRDAEGRWVQMETYLRANRTIEFTHTLCEGCAKRLYPDFF